MQRINLLDGTKKNVISGFVETWLVVVIVLVGIIQACLKFLLSQLQPALDLGE